jgi:hypothetical protein
VAQKLAQGGSRHADYLNMAVDLSVGDFGVILCDDDALIPTYFSDASQWLVDHPDQQYGYCHVVDFDPTLQPISDDLPRQGLTNRTDAVNGFCKIDSSQILWRLNASRGPAGIKFQRRTESVDAHFLQDMFNRYGACPFTGFFGQFKARFRGQLGNRVSLREDLFTDTERSG